MPRITRVFLKRFDTFSRNLNGISSIQRERVIKSVLGRYENYNLNIKRKG